MDKELVTMVVLKHELEDYLKDERYVHRQLEQSGNRHVLE
jgi:hypothetical protein